MAAGLVAKDNGIHSRSTTPKSLTLFVIARQLY
jgi:hypothetical protein